MAAAAPRRWGARRFGVASLTTGIVDEIGLGSDFYILRFGVPALMLVAASTLGPALPDNALTRFGVRLGDASYALYLIHPFIVRPLREIWLKFAAPTWPLAGYCTLCMIGAVAVALALHNLFERPITQALQRLPALHKKRETSGHNAPLPSRMVN